MREFWTVYGIFLAEAVTVVVAGVAAVAVIVALVARGMARGRSRGVLRVRDLGRYHDDLARSLSAGMLPGRRGRRRGRAERRRRGRSGQAQAQAQDKAQAQAQGKATEGEGLVALTGGGQRRPRVFVLDFLGDVRASQVGALRQEITAVLAEATAQDEVVLRLENRGGLVHDHGLAASQLLRLRQRGIPLTVAVDKIAASGGYLMACVADRIVAAPFAVVGSIGVIAELPNFHRLLDRNGIAVEQFKGGEHKRTVTMFGATTEEDRARLDSEIQDTHALFKEFVAAHRSQVDVETAGTGQHWYGTRALQLQLVDEIITSDDYLVRARERADVFEVSFVPPRAAGRSALSRLPGITGIAGIAGIAELARIAGSAGITGAAGQAGPPGQAAPRD